MTNEAVIAVLTYKRPGPLVVAAAGADPRGRRRRRCPTGVLVIDNDPRGQRQPRRSPGSPISGVRYVNEVRPGIAAARNRALDESVSEDLLVFIDDDEHPCDGWLSMLIATWRQSTPAAVVGPVISEFDAQPDAWVAAGDFFRRRRLPTGSAGHRGGNQQPAAGHDGDPGVGPAVRREVRHLRRLGHAVHPGHHRQGRPHGLVRRGRGRRPGPDVADHPTLGAVARVAQRQRLEPGQSVPGPARAPTR